jgi:hypothetical protein
VGTELDQQHSAQFSPEAFAEFVCESFSIDWETGEVLLNYALTGPGEVVRFTERLTFPLPASPVSDERRAHFAAILPLLHVVAGVSYFKAAAPATVVAAASPLTAAESEFAQQVYTLGLGEFAVRNDLRHVLDTSVSVTAGVEPDHPRIEGEPGDPLVPCGGGKDSIVSAEILDARGYSPTLAAVNPNWAIREVAGISGHELLAVSRRIDPELIRLNGAGARNGHVPVTAVNSLILVALAALHGFGPVIMSNESSSSLPNLTWNSVDVNHQWSKGLAAELLLQRALQSRTGLVGRYFSILRPFTELQIAQRFAAETRYDAVVTSCNTAFKLRDPAPPGKRWCRDCPKCRFVFLALAPFSTAARLEGIFGGNMFDDPAQLSGFRELIGLGQHKPFECVGEVDECLAALQRVAGQPDWQSRPVVQTLVADVGPGLASGNWGEVLNARGPASIPAEYAWVNDGLA